MKQFPEVLYKGNSVNATFNIKRADKEYTFQNGDLISIGIKKEIGDKDYILRKQFNVPQKVTSVAINLTPEDTENIPICKAILEVALKFNNGNDFKTVYQKEIELKGVVLDDY